MKQFEYKFFKLPGVGAKEVLFTKGKDINDIRFPLLEESFNMLGKEGWELIEITWLEGLAVFKREIKM